MDYKAETSFIVTDDNRMVYNLRQTGWFKGDPRMSNDIAVTIDAHHLSDEVKADIAATVQAALNAKFGLHAAPEQYAGSEAELQFLKNRVDQLFRRLSRYEVPPMP